MTPTKSTLERKLPFWFHAPMPLESQLTDSKPGKLVFKRTITLKDTWAKLEKKHGQV